MTDELLVLYLDDAIDRRSDRIEADFESTVEAVRVGYITARDDKAHRRWIRRSRTTAGDGLTGIGLERRVMGLKMTNPDLVAMPGEPVRRMKKAVA